MPRYTAVVRVCKLVAMHKEQKHTERHTLDVHIDFE